MSRNVLNFVAAVLSAVFALFVLPAGLASAETITVHSRGTGQAMPSEVVTHGDDGTTIENAYPAQIFPIPGQVVPYNKSVELGNKFGVDAMSHWAKPGDTAVFDGYSQGAVVAGDSAEQYYLLGRSNGQAEVMYTTDSDPRLRGTGIEVVLQEFTDGLPQLGYPFVQFRGERLTQGQIASVNKCDLYDLICNANHPILNPGGTLASFVGYLQGHHNYGDISKYPAEVLSYDGGNTIVIVVNKGNPLVKLGNDISETLTGESLSDGETRLIEALSPTDTPGSREHVAPNPVDVSVAAGEVAAETLVEVAPQVGATVGGAVAGAIGNQVGGPVVGAVATEIGQQVGTEIATAAAESAAPIVQEGVKAATESLMTGDPAAFNSFVGAHLPGVPALPTR
jgi:PE-PPE domain